MCFLSVFIESDRKDIVQISHTITTGEKTMLRLMASDNSTLEE